MTADADAPDADVEAARAWCGLGAGAELAVLQADTDAAMRVYERPGFRTVTAFAVHDEPH